MIPRWLPSVRHTLNGIRHSPGYSATVVLTLALTVGVTTAVFSIINGVLLKPLAYPDADRLVFLRETWRELTDAGETLPVSERHFEYWRANARSFDVLAQYIAVPANLTGGGEASQATVVQASGTLFDVLGVGAARGRVLRRDDEQAGAVDVAVLSSRLWRERFGADPNIVGRSITLDGRLHLVVGVLPADLRLPIGSRLTDRFDAVVPLREPGEHIGWVGEHNSEAIGRLRAGVLPEQARTELDVLQRQVSDLASAQAKQPVSLGSAVSPLAERIVGRSRTGLLLLMAAICGVLLIACSNLANLSLTRASARQRQAAIRAALGASQPRLMIEATVEQVTLAVAGGALGIAVAWAALAIFVRTAPIDIPRVSDVALDSRVLLFAAAVSVAAGLLVAVLPAWRVRTSSLQNALRASGTAVTGDRAAGRTRQGLLALQVALSAVLLVVTTLLAVSFVRVMSVDRGYDADRVLTLGISLPESRCEKPDTAVAAYDRMLTAVRAVPGVVGVTSSSMLPLNGEGMVNFIAADGDPRPITTQPSANFRLVGPEFFRTLGVPIIRGRTFRLDERNPNAPMPALISLGTAHKLWPGQDPLGRRFSRRQRGEQSFEVVGLVADARTTSIEAPPPLMVYLPYWWRTRTTLTMMVRSAVDPLSLVSPIRQAIRQIDPDIAIGRVRPFGELIDAAVAARRYQMRLFIFFGATALVIAILGVYGVTAYGVSRRRREMNIRVALGARPFAVTWMVVRQGSVPILVGLVAGIIGASAIAATIRSLLFGVEARNPAVIASVVAVVGVIGLLACVVAARGNLSLDPAAVLREE